MELWRVYRFARFVRQKTKEHKNFASEDFLRVQFHLTKKRWFTKSFSLEQVGQIVDYARKKEYIARYGTTENKLRVSMPHGSDLLDLPIGTLQEFLKQYGLVVSFLTGSAFTGFVIFIWNLIF